MSQVAENRARVTVVALERGTAGRSPGWVTQRVRVTEASDIADEMNLLGSDLPREFTALVPDSTTLAPGDVVQLEASLVGPGRLRIAPPEPAAEPERTPDGDEG